MAIMITHSLIIPVYKNAKNIDSLLKNLTSYFKEMPFSGEVIFVIDGNPESEYQILRNKLKKTFFEAQLILHSRNFGSFAAIRTGLEHAQGKYIATMSADEQEPLSLIHNFFEILEKGEVELVVGTRKKRSDAWLTTVFSNLFWKTYRYFVNPEIPDGGVDVFACSSRFKDELLQLSEANTSLVGQIYWLGFERKTVFYERQKRRDGKSAWTFSKKMKYMIDSIFSFTDLPLKLLLALGFSGIFISVSFAFIILFAKSLGEITVPGYSSTFLIVTFFGSINIVCSGIVGLYMYRTYENTKQRPLTIVSRLEKFRPKR
jgi:glycosyltransferase involved in cell wall biosynthesis